MPYVVARPCVGVRAAFCTGVSAVDCIDTTDESPQYHIDPSQLPAERRRYVEINAQFFAVRS